MNSLTRNEMAFVLNVFKSPETEYNANSISKVIGISSMGALKIAKRLEKEGVVSSRELGKAKFYRLKLDSDYVREYVRFLLKMEAEQAHPYVKMWIDEIRKLKSAYSAILFGSVIGKHKEAGDIDVVLITGKKKFHGLKQEIDEINRLNVKRLHPVFQTKEDFVRNMKKGDRVLLEAIRGVVVFGEDKIIELMQK